MAKKTDEEKKRISDAQKARWAAKKAAEAQQPALAPVPAPATPPSPNPTVVAFQQQLIPFVEKREAIQMHVRRLQKEMQQYQAMLAEAQQDLQDTENAIQYRLNMISQLTGQPQMQMPSIQVAPMETQMSPYGGYQINSRPGPVAVPSYQGEVPSLQGNPNIPSWLTSVPAKQNERYSSGYVPGRPEDNPRTESAVDVREDPQTREVVMAMAKARAAV